MPKSSIPVFPGGLKVLYCKECGVPPEYCPYMDTPAACDEWLESRHPDFYEDLLKRRRRTEEERAAHIAALEAKKNGGKAKPASAADGTEELDEDEAAMVAAMDAEIAADEAINADQNAPVESSDANKSGGGGDVVVEKEKEKKKKRKTRRGGANNRRQTGKSSGSEVQEVVLSRVQRNKRKFVTVVLGLETFGHKIKSAAKKLGKRFACGAAVSTNDTNRDEIVIQGDCLSDLPKLLMEKYNVPIANMFVLAKGRKVPLNDLRTS